MIKRFFSKQFQNNFVSFTRFKFSASQQTEPGTQNLQNEKVITVCVDGAAGKISNTFIPLLLTGTVFGPNTKINLNLIDIEPAQDALKGLAYEIEDCDFTLLNSLKIGTSHQELLKDIDVGVFLASSPKPWKLRSELLEPNKEIYQNIGNALNSVAKKDVKCLVVANPANTLCYMLSQFAPSIPKQNFTCLSRLDLNRTIFQIAKKAQVPIDSIKDAIIWGNHSLTLFPDIHQVLINGKNIKEVIKDEQWLHYFLLEKVRKRAYAILEKRKFSAVLGTACAMKDHLKDWYQGRPDSLVSMGVISDGAYGVPTGLCYSFPIRCTGNFEYHIEKKCQLDSQILENLAIIQNELLEEKKQAGF